MDLIFTCTDMSFYNAQEDAAKLDKKAREQAAFCGVRIDGDSNLVALQMRQQSQGFITAIIYRNKYGFAVRPAEAGHPRISPNFTTFGGAFEWAKEWYNEAPHKREVMSEITPTNQWRF
jgi:hypothetical protein